MQNEQEKIEIYYSSFIDEEPEEVPFPQANSFDLIIKSINFISLNKVSARELAECLKYNEREGKYYIDALRYLGIVKKEDKQGYYILTDEGRFICTKDNSEQKKILIGLVLKHEPFHKAFGSYVSNSKIPEKKEVVEYIKDSIANLSENTLGRRASTIISWIKWIINCEF